jgi:hypothetical protein
MTNRIATTKRPRATARINSKLDKNLGAYMAAAGAAGVSILALAQPAQAKVMYTPAYIRLNNNLILDINHDGTYDFGIHAYGFCISQEVGSLCGQSFRLNASSYSKGKFMGAPGFGSALFAGAQIGPAGQFSAGGILGTNFTWNSSVGSSPPNWFGPFANGGKGVRDRYLGLKFTIGEEPHYGWMRISVQIPNAKKRGFKMFITGYAYETEPNKAITAGQKTDAPESSIFTPALPKTAPAPATLGALARGADAIAIWRRDEESALR